MTIEILACIGCGHTVDQWTMCYGCKECGGKFFKQIRPSYYRILCWFFNNPKHVWQLIKEDLREKFSA